jgi:hypothetical protein
MSGRSYLKGLLYKEWRKERHISFDFFLDTGISEFKKMYFPSILPYNIVLVCSSPQIYYENPLYSTLQLQFACIPKPLSFFGMFTKLLEATIGFVMSVHLYSAPAMQIFIKFCIEWFY